MRRTVKVNEHYVISKSALLGAFGIRSPEKAEVTIWIPSGAPVVHISIETTETTEL
jgi:hypothetical protein